MNRITCLDLTTNKRFDKYFDSYYLMQKFINKCKYSKKIKVTVKPPSL